MDHLHQPASASASLKSVAESSTKYTCPMHPEIHRAQPGKCPKCGMALVPVA